MYIVHTLLFEILNFLEGFKLLFIKQMNLLLRNFHSYDLYTQKFHYFLVLFAF